MFEIYAVFVCVCVCVCMCVWGGVRGWVFADVYMCVESVYTYACGDVCVCVCVHVCCVCVCVCVCSAILYIYTCDDKVLTDWPTLYRGSDEMNRPGFV